MKLLAVAMLFIPASAFAEGQCSMVHMLGSTGQYVFKDADSGWQKAATPYEGIRKPGGHLAARGTLLRQDGKPLYLNEFNLTTIDCEHDHEYNENAQMISKGIKCKLIKAYVHELAGKNCFLDLDTEDFDMRVSTYGLTGESSLGTDVQWNVLI